MSMTFTPKSSRIACCVPFCRRTAKASESDTEDTEVICGKHGRLIDAEVRREHRRLFRELSREMDRAPEDSTVAERAAVLKKWRRADELWALMKRQAIERAAGI